MIRWYMNRIHVATSDEDVATDIGARAVAAGWHPLACIGAIGHALDCHHANQTSYALVMGSH